MVSGGSFGLPQSWPRPTQSHLGLEGSDQPSICLPPVERSSAGWYRYPGLAGVRFCLYRKCLRRLEATLLRKYGFGLDSTPLGLGLLIGCLGKLSGTTVFCGEPLDPGPAFWTSEVEGGVNVIRDLISDLELLVGQSDSLVSDLPA
ncbi:uncharacterized protein [Mobula birostris]|uniref:uncharacterized protein isoform X3 n=1 Tax=Mobula birostris TaxID=1983395 RepID=UPI003B28731F